MKDKGFIKSLINQEHLPLPLLAYSTADVDLLGKTICALLNANGGWIVVGALQNGESTDVSPQLASDIQSSVVAGITPLPLVYVQSETEDGKTIVLVTVMKGSLPPYTFNGSFYVMVGKEITKPTFDQTAMLLRDSMKIRTTWEADDCLKADEYSLNQQLMQFVYDSGVSIGRLRESENGLADVLSELKLMSVMSVSNGAVVLFANDTRRLLPQCRVRIQVMLGGKAADYYDDTQIIEGNIFTCLENVITYFKDKLPMISRFSNARSHREDMLLYPIEVIDEAVSNALIHRDYTDRTDEVTIFIYRDKIEITNTGEMPSGILISKNKFNPHGSILRNPLMAEIFYVAGKMEKTGRGLQLISGKMKEMGVKLPEWRCENGKTCLTIYKTSTKRSLPARALKFLDTHKRGDYFTKRDYLSSFDKPMSDTSAKNDLMAMVNKGLIEVVGRGPSTKYKIRK